LELLKTHNATHLLIVSDDIAKYTAFSSIGSDENFDRTSYLPIFITDPQIKKEMDQENNKILSFLFKGEFILDEDLFYEGTLFPRDKAKIIGVIVSMKQSKEGGPAIKQPLVIVSYANSFKQIPLNCLYFKGKEYLFSDVQINHYDGCLQIIPLIKEKEEVDVLGAGIFLSPNTRNTLFTQLYLFDKNEKNDENLKGFRKVYDGSSNGYVMVFDDVFKKIWGPIKIWELSYDNTIKTNSSFLS